MKRHLLLIALSLCAITLQAGRIITDSIRSTTLRATVKYNVYLPSGFERSQDQYPVVYLLHGLTDTYTAWDQKGCMREIADELIESHEATPMIIIMPNAGGPDTRNTPNGYFNMQGWDYEDFFFNELMPTAERKYRAISDKQHRAVMGLSMGGGGSLGYALRHTDTFSSCYAMSPWLNSQSPQPGPGGEKNRMYYTVEAVHQHSALTFIDNADEHVKENLRTVAWYLDCGDDDGLINDTFEFYKKLRLAGIKAELRVRNGVHNWEYWRHSLRQALPYASCHFGK